MNDKTNPNLVTRNGQRIHVIHDRDNRASYGYVLQPSEDGQNVHVRVARSVCSKQDSFNKKVAIRVVKNRLDSGPKGSNQHRMFDSTIAVPVPSNSNEWRELDQTIVSLANLKLTEPEKIRRWHSSE